MRFYTKLEIDNLEADARQKGYADGEADGFSEYRRELIQAHQNIATAIASKSTPEEAEERNEILIGRAAERARQMVKSDITTLDNKIARLQDKASGPGCESEWLRTLELRVKNLESSNLRQSDRLARQEDYIKSLENKLTAQGLTVDDIMTNFTKDEGKPAETLTVTASDAVSLIEKVRSEGREFYVDMHLQPVKPKITVVLPTIPSNGHGKGRKQPA